MILRNCRMEEFSQRTFNKKIICFGAYVMPVGMCNEYSELQLENRIIFMADNDVNKHGKTFDLCGYSKRIISAEEVAKKADTDTVILITSSYYAAIIDQLDAYKELDNTECYVYPIMKSVCSSYEKIDPRNTDKPLIPKTIHYFWFGGNKKSELINMCIDSWKKYCPDYEIIEWNESNYDVRKNRFMSEAYDAEKWAFVSDYARLDVLCQYGGIYMDTDVEVIKPLDELLYNEAYLGFGNYGRVASGLGFGCIKSAKIITEILKLYDSVSFNKDIKPKDLTTNTMRETTILTKYGLQQNNKYQKVLNSAIFPSDFFAPTIPGTSIKCITDNTFSIHHNNFSWANEQEKKEYSDSINATEKIIERMKLHEK